MRAAHPVDKGKIIWLNKHSINQLNELKSEVTLQMLAEAMNLSALWACLIIAVASSSVSITITQTELFAPLRALMQKTGHMIGYLFKCFYCMKHWVVAALILIYQPILIESGFSIVDLAVSWFFTVTISSFVSGAMFKVFLLAMGSKMKEKELMAADKNQAS